MAHRSVEIVIGRLLTDEDFRERFVNHPERAIDELAEAGLELTAAEMSALRATDASTWMRLASALDPRLQKATLHPSRESQA
jgi:hypothetical protein